MSSQLIAQRLRGDVCRLECWKLQRVCAWWDRGGQGFPRGQYAQLPTVRDDRGPFVYRMCYTRARGRPRRHTFIAQLPRHVHPIKISGRAHSSAGLLHGNNHRIPSALSSRIQTHIARRCELSGFCRSELKLLGARVRRFGAASNAQLTHVNYATLQTSGFSPEDSFELNWSTDRPKENRLK